MAAHWRELPERVNATNDFFIRTTDPEHERVVQEFLQAIYDRGEIYEGTYAGLYCFSCEAFYSEAELVDGRCPQHGTVPEYVEEKNYFFRLSAYADRLLALYDERPDFVLPRFRSNEARSFIEQGLQDISVSRASQRWGVPVHVGRQPGHLRVGGRPHQATSARSPTRGRAMDRVRASGPRAHMLAKDILHCVIWPALLLAAGYDVPRRLFVHGYLLRATIRRCRSRSATSSTHSN